MELPGLIRIDAPQGALTPSLLRNLKTHQDSSATCPWCDGEGKVNVFYVVSPDGPDLESWPCGFCHGTGTIRC